jgi:uncharacterized protein (TIGR00251 family)
MGEASWRARERDGGVEITLRVSPRASRDAIGGTHDGALKVALTAPPVEGEANEALRALFAKALGVGKRAITIVRGDHARTKTVFVEGLTEAELRERVGG